jgi:hypothetical protein
VPCGLISFTAAELSGRFGIMAQVVDVSIQHDESCRARRFETWVQLFASGLLRV